MKKVFAVILAALLVCGLLFGCGKANDGAAAENMFGSANGALRDEAGEDAITDSAQSSTEQSSTVQVNPNQKLVRKIWLDTETEDMDALLVGITQRIAELGGYVESRNVYNGSQYNGRRYRSGELTIRIPAEQLDNFVQHVSENSNITNNKETADDITLSYVATESRITALETEEKRLLELLAGAETMADLLEIESRLTDVRTELEQVKSRLRLYDNQVSYGTIYLTVSEVKEYTVVEEPETVWERIGAGFMESLKTLGGFFTELFVTVVVGIPYLVLIGIVLTAVILLMKRRRKKKANKQETAE